MKINQVKIEPLQSNKTEPHFFAAGLCNNLLTVLLLFRNRSSIVTTFHNPSVCLPVNPSVCPFLSFLPSSLRPFLNPSFRPFLPYSISSSTSSSDNPTIRQLVGLTLLPCFSLYIIPFVRPSVRPHPPSVTVRHLTYIRPSVPPSNGLITVCFSSISSSILLSGHPSIQPHVRVIVPLRDRQTIIYLPLLSFLYRNRL